MRVQAAQTIDLAFNMPGVISLQNFDPATRKGPAFLGSRVAAYDLENQLYGKLGDIGDAATGRLAYDSRKIRDSLSRGNQPPFLFSLRNESLAAALDQAIARREAGYMSRFKHAPAIAQLSQELAPKITKHLEELAKKSADRFSEVDAAYDDAATPPDLKGVVKRLSSTTLTPAAQSVSTTSSHPVSMISSPFAADQPAVSDIEVKTFDKDGTTLVQLQKTPRTSSTPAVRDNTGKWQIPTTPFETQTVASTSPRIEQQTASVPQGLFHPRHDNAIAYSQAMVAVLQETARHKAASFSVGDVQKIIERELAAADADIRTLQLNFIHTFLTPPAEGVVTGLFKDVGESVEPGEPVLRIENDAWLLLMARVNSTTPLWLDRKVQITLSSVFENQQTQSIDGRVVAIRGHEVDNDEWEIVIEAKNPVDAAGRRILPINYHFDPDTDVLTVI
jgi:biotin carboxyl carrier protein